MISSPAFRLGVLLLGAFGSSVAHALQQKRGVILFTEVAFKGLRTSPEDSVAFYPWISSALHKATDDQGSAFVLLDGATVATRASSRGLDPVVAYFDRKHRDVAHLAFYDDQMPQLSAVAQELGAAFLVRARLLSNATRVKRLQEKRVLGVTIQGDFTELTRTVSVEFMVFDVAANRVAFTRVFSSGDSSAKADSKVSRRIAAGIMTALASGGAETEPPGMGNDASDSAVVAVERAAVSSVPEYRVTLQRVVLSGNLLRFDMTLWNTTDENVSAVLRRNRQNEIESYIVDSLRIRTQAASSSLANMTLLARAGEKVGFFIVFPIPGTNLKKVSVSSAWDLRLPSLSVPVIVSLKDVTLP